MDPITWLSEFYKNNKELAIALVSALAASVLTLTLVFIRNILNVIRVALVFIGKKIGGGFAYKSALDSYLNWMVVEHQDLNLTGIIGSGPKPKLEQVFISLNLGGESEPLIEEQPSGIVARQRIIRDVLRIKAVEPNKHVYKTEVESESIAFYHRPKMPKVKCFFERNGDLLGILALLLVLVLLAGFFALLPAYLLFGNATPNLWSIGLAGLILGVAAGLLAAGLTASFKEKETILILMTGIPLTLYIITFAVLALLKGITANRATFAILGTVVTAFAIYIWTRTSNRPHSNDEFAKQLRKLLEQHNNIAILGKPGSGKSTFVQFLALTFAREKAGEKGLRRHGIVKAKLGLNKWYLPVLIPLRKVSRILLDGDAKTDSNLLLVAWRDNILPSDIRAEFSDKFFATMLKQKRCIFLLDGLDEVANDEEFQAVVKEIRGFSSRYAGNKFIITSRFSGWRGGVGSAFQELEVDDLTNVQIENFIEDWYKAIEENRVTVAGNETQTEKAHRLRKAMSRANDLKKALAEIEGIRRLAENPLLLSIVCFVHYNKTLPRERVSLYQDCSNLLLLQWDREKGLAVDDTNLTLVRKEAIMQEIAYAMHTGKIGEKFGGKEAAGAEIVDVIEKTLRQFRLPVENAGTLFQKLVDRSGIIVSVEKFSDRFAFSHLTFQEFYTAKYIHENQQDLQAQLLDKSDDKLGSWWREVILLYVSLIKDSSKFIGKICPKSQAAMNDLPAKRLQIAAQCLSQAIAVQDETIECRILQNLLDVRLGTRRGIRVGANCWGDLRTYLLEFVDRPDFYRYALEFNARELSQVTSFDVLAANLIQLGKSLDSDVASASLHVLRKLVREKRVGKLKALVPDEVIELFDHPNEQVRLEVLRLICSQVDLLAERTVLDKALSQFENRTPGELFVNWSAERRLPITVPILDKVELDLLRQLPKVPYKSRTDKDWVRETIWGVFRTRTVSDRSLAVRLGSVVGLEEIEPEHRAAVAACIVLLSTTEARVSYIAEFKEMLHIGNEVQQFEAIKIYEILSKEIENRDIVEELTKALQSPYKRVRLAALKALGNIGVNSSYLEQLAPSLEAGLDRPSFLHKTSANLARTFVGKVYVGKSIQERLEIIRLLAKINGYHMRFEFDKLLLAYMDQNDTDQLMEIFEVLGSLSDHELDPDIAARSLNLYRVMLTQYDTDQYKHETRMFMENGAIVERRLHNFIPLKPLVILSQRFDVAHKLQVAELLLQMVRNMQDNDSIVAALRGLLEFKGSVSIPEDVQKQILTSLGHKSWRIADTAFEVAVRYNMI